MSNQPARLLADEKLLIACPRRVRVVCAVVAVTIVVVFIVVTWLLGQEVHGTKPFGLGDQMAMLGLGVILAASTSLFARPRLEASSRGLYIRNIIGSYELPWELIRAVRFEHGTAWASVELVNDDTLAVMAIQAADRQYAVQVIQELRLLLKQFQQS